MPDSGFFLDEDRSPTYGSKMRNVFDFQQSSAAGLNAACVAAHTPTKDVNMCIFGRWKQTARPATLARPCVTSVNASPFVVVVCAHTHDPTHTRSRAHQRAHQDADLPAAVAVRQLADQQRHG
jgi:hypothetical protein